MSSDGKIYIVVTDKTPGNTPNPFSPDPDLGPKKTAEKKDDALSRFAERKLTDFVWGQFKKDIDFQISNIGNFTGNYVVQAQAQNAQSAVMGLAGVGMAIWGATKLIDPFAGIIAGGVAIASSIINFVHQEKINQLNFRKQNYDLDILKERSGLYALDNGSRTGGY